MNICNQDLTKEAFNELKELLIAHLEHLKEINNNEYGINEDGIYYVTYIESRKEVSLFNYPQNNTEKEFEIVFHYELYTFIVPDSYCISGDSSYKYGTREERLEDCKKLRKKIDEYEQNLLN